MKHIVSCQLRLYVSCLSVFVSLKNPFKQVVVLIIDELVDLFIYNADDVNAGSQ